VAGPSRFGSCRCTPLFASKHGHPKVQAERAMVQDSKIGWTDHTQNFWWGCHKVSEECHFCYISGIMKRGGYEPFRGPMRTKNWSNPRRWNRAARQSGKRMRVFTCSMPDFFHPGAADLSSRQAENLEPRKKRNTRNRFSLSCHSVFSWLFLSDITGWPVHQSWSAAR
jgi:hypothetical protein